MKDLPRHPKPDHTHSNAVSHIPAILTEPAASPHAETESCQVNRPQFDIVAYFKIGRF
jgi:hypothetical protein